MDGIFTLKEQQRTTTKAFCAKDVFDLTPTGFGKSERYNARSEVTGDRHNVFPEVNALWSLSSLVALHNALRFWIAITFVIITLNFSMT